MGSGTFWVYALALENGRFYVGQTNDLARRLGEHIRGRSRYTRRSGVRGLVYAEECASRTEAMQRERFLKSGQGREWLRKRLVEQSALGG